MLVDLLFSFKYYCFTNFWLAKIRKKKTNGFWPLPSHNGKPVSQNVADLPTKTTEKLEIAIWDDTFLKYISVVSMNSSYPDFIVKLCELSTPEVWHLSL